MAGGEGLSIGDLDASIRLFFEDPTIYYPPPRTYSVLYLLRRDIRTCLGIDPNTGAMMGMQALWPGAMALLAGVDLLGKFLAGTDKVGETGERFRKFLQRYFQLASEEDAEIIYQLRNALLHSFGLYSKTRRNREYRFVLVGDKRPLVQSLEGNHYLISVFALYERFERAVGAYRADLKSDDVLRRNFSAMFPYYGSIVVR